MLGIVENIRTVLAEKTLISPGPGKGDLSETLTA